MGSEMCIRDSRGSAFGGIGQGDQPTTEQFENELFQKLDSLDPDQRVWVEDEGNRIGTVVVPGEFHHRLRNSPAVFLESSPEQRVKNLAVDYGDLGVDELEQSIAKIRKRLGPQHADEAIRALGSLNVERAIAIVLAYYDRTYLKAVNSMPRNEMPSLSIDGMSDSEIVAGLQKVSNGFAEIRLG